MPGFPANSHSSLADILMDMVRSALAWENEPGFPQVGHDQLEGLTGMPLRINCLPPCGRLPEGSPEEGDE